jgi:hypothetical protein
MGEWDFEQNAVVKAVEQAREQGELRLSTPGGRFQVRWDEGGAQRRWGSWPSLPSFSRFRDCSSAGWEPVR